MKQENDIIQTTKIMLISMVITRYHIHTNLYWCKEVEKLSCNSKKLARIWLWNKLSCVSSKSSWSGRRKSTNIHKIILNIYSQFSRRISAIKSESWTSLIQNKEDCGMKSNGLLRMTVNTGCQRWRNRRKETGCQNKQWKLTRREAKLKKYKISKEGFNRHRKLRKKCINKN